VASDGINGHEDGAAERSKAKKQVGMSAMQAFLGTAGAAMAVAAAAVGAGNKDGAGMAVTALAPIASVYEKREFSILCLDTNGFKRNDGPRLYAICLLDGIEVARSTPGSLSEV
jgi:hypothetical protein